MTYVSWKDNGPHSPQSATLAQVEDYDAGDPCLDIARRADGKFDLVIYRGKEGAGLIWLKLSHSSKVRHPF